MKNYISKFNSISILTGFLLAGVILSSSPLFVFANASPYDAPYVPYSPYPMVSSGNQYYNYYYGGNQPEPLYSWGWDPWTSFNWRNQPPQPPWFHWDRDPWKWKGDSGQWVNWNWDWRDRQPDSERQRKIEEIRVRIREEDNKCRLSDQQLASLQGHFEAIIAELQQRAQIDPNVDPQVLAFSQQQGDIRYQIIIIAQRVEDAKKQRHQQKVVCDQRKADLERQLAQVGDINISNPQTRQIFH